MSPADEVAELKMDATLLRILPPKLEQRLGARCGALGGAKCRLLAIPADEEASFMFQFIRRVEEAGQRRPKQRGCRPGCAIA